MPSSFAHLLAALIVSSTVFAPTGQATLLNANNLEVGSAVVFETDFGDVTVGLFDSVTPLTVTNFLNYVEGTTANGGKYNPGFFHRYVSGSILQAGYSNLFLQSDFPNLPGDTLSNPIAVDSPVPNEPFVSNTLGTIAMAKAAGDPDSATSQFFFNLNDNSADLDVQNGGFTVFGRVIGGLDVLLNGVAGLTPANLEGLFLDPNYSAVPVEDFANALDLSNWASYSVSTVLLGDYNGNGEVDAADYTVWADNFGSMTNLSADGNFNGIVDAADYTVWQDNFGNSLPAAALSVPEPATALLIIGGSVVLSRRVRR